MTIIRFDRKSRAGFTLLEVVIAIALIGTIIAFLATMTAQWLPNWNRDFGRVQRNELLALGLERVVADLAAAEFAPAVRGTSQLMFDGVDRSVIFVRTELAPHARPGLEFVRIAETSSDDGPILVRTRAAYVPFGGEANERNRPNFADPVVLVRAPYRLSFSYAGADRIWRETWQRSSQLPRAIKVTLQDAATQRTLAASTATLVHAEIAPDCIVAKSLADCLASRARPARAAGPGTGGLR